MVIRLPAATGRRLLWHLFLLLAGAQVIVGVVWTIQSLGEVAQYGDTTEYLSLADTLRVDAYRGLLYPALLALVNWLSPTHDLLTWRPTMAGGAPIGVWLLQLLQLVASLAAIAYFLRIVGRWAPSDPRDKGLASSNQYALLLLVLFDPLVAHFNLSLMTDGLALSASLVFCAAMADVRLGVLRPVTSKTLLIVSALAVASLRSEKPLVLVGTALATLVGWRYFGRHEPEFEQRLSRGRGLQMMAITAGTVLVVVLGHASVRVAGTRMSVGESILTQRVVFPHLESVYDEMPASVTSRIGRDAAHRYDSHVNEARSVVDESSGGDATLRHTLTQQMAGVVVRTYAAEILLDILKDALENIAATPSFYLRLGLSHILGEDQQRVFGPAQWTYSRLALYHPFTSALYLAVAVGLLIVGLPLAVACFRGSRIPGTPWIARRSLVVWTPIAAFTLTNAFAFALTADFVHVRYVLFAHVGLLVIVFRAALAWTNGGRRNP